MKNILVDIKGHQFDGNKFLQIVPNLHVQWYMYVIQWIHNCLK